MQRTAFLDRMVAGRLTRRQMLAGAAAFGVAPVVARPRAARAAPDLVVMEWSGYDVPELFPAFVAKHGGPPEFSIFANEDEALQKVLGGFAADVMHPCTYSVRQFVEAGVAKPIDPSRLSHWPDLFPFLANHPALVYSDALVMTPCEWGNASIAYRTDLVDPAFAEAESWGIFFDPAYEGKLTFTDDAVAHACAGLVLGYGRDEIFRMTPEQLEATRPLVAQLLKNCRFIWSDPTELNQALASGEVVAGYAWNETVKSLTAEGVPVKYATPKEGVFTWLCGLTLLEGGRGDEAAAYDFLDAWLSPETGRFMIEEYGYGHSSAKAFAAADPAQVAALGIADPAAHLDAGILFLPQEPEHKAAQDALWQELRALQ
jgi:spermidine/putrescine-binding protein